MNRLNREIDAAFGRQSEAQCFVSFEGLRLETIKDRIDALADCGLELDVQERARASWTADLEQSEALMRGYRAELDAAKARLENLLVAHRLIYFGWQSDGFSPKQSILLNTILARGGAA